ncbi:RBP11-like subunits of RNA polymerase [Trichoderma longibrachiatum ATCC 18648]|uniref:RBP11-like subunits of RNA polymerase n=1 Tax=Trichoderma longibrachiatum ATCC 18648 TaxID=983965 RepID=A0A2T4CIK2_TRILO|nr:RBP11-like subunits of RNA polymerase [Trichoderma longibrachiatum ATCC 18648]
MKQTVGINKETVSNVSSTDFPGHFPGEDHAFSIDRFKSAFSVQFHRNEPNDASFSLVGIDASLANAFRRILIAEIPTLAIEDGVIGLEKISREEASRAGSGYEGHAGELKAVVKDTMKDTVSREALRHPEFEGKVKLGRRRDHFIFSIESTGQWDSDELFLEAVKHMKLKCKKLEQQVINMVQ